MCQCTKDVEKPKPGTVFIRLGAFVLCFYLMAFVYAAIFSAAFE